MQMLKVAVTVCDVAIVNMQLTACKKLSSQWKKKLSVSELTLFHVAECYEFEV